MTIAQTNNIAFIGAGNTSWQLAHQFKKAGLPITSIYSRNLCNNWISSLGIENYQLTDSPIIKENTVFLLVADKAIASLARQEFLAGKTLIHSSGSLTLGVLPPNSGVFYPLQTLTKGRLLKPNQIPIYLESESQLTIHLLESYCEKVGFAHSVIASDQRANLHMSAVMVNNFTNHLLHKAFQLASEHQMNPTLLIPLLKETIAKFEELGGKQAQTGPAKRNDQEVIEKHLAQLPTGQLKDLYASVTKSIIKEFNGG